jgi:hypothetical protein
VSPDRAEGGLSIFCRCKGQEARIAEIQRKQVLQINGTGTNRNNEVTMWRKLRNENDSVAEILLHGIDARLNPTSLVCT